MDSLATKINHEDSLVFSGEEDPDLIKASLPLMMKMVEVLIQGSPEDPRLKQTAAKLFTSYAALWLEPEARKLEEDNYELAERQRYRAKRMYLRAKNYGLQGLRQKFQEFEVTPWQLPEGLTKEDAPLLTWTGLAWVAWIQLSADDPFALSQLKEAVRLLEQALLLDGDYERGINHEFFIRYYSSSLVQVSDKLALAESHFEKLQAITGGQKCSPYLVWAESFALSRQDKKEFTKMLDLALAVDLDKIPADRLVNTLCQEQARWYLSQMDDLFL